MLRTRHHQQTLWGGVWAKEVDDLWEPWMRQADRLLDDDGLVTKIFEAQGKRWKKSRTRGRLQTPAEVVLRLLVLKHVRDWSYQTLEREVRANLVYRNFTRIGTETVPEVAKSPEMYRFRLGGGTSKFVGNASQKSVP